MACRSLGVTFDELSQGGGFGRQDSYDGGSMQGGGQYSDHEDAGSYHQTVNYSDYEPQVALLALALKHMRIGRVV